MIPTAKEKFDSVDAFIVSERKRIFQSTLSRVEQALKCESNSHITYVSIPFSHFSNAGLDDAVEMLRSAPYHYRVIKNPHNVKTNVSNDQPSKKTHTIVLIGRCDF